MAPKPQLMTSRKEKQFGSLSSRNGASLWRRPTLGGETIHQENQIIGWRLHPFDGSEAVVEICAFFRNHFLEAENRVVEHRRVPGVQPLAIAPLDDGVRLFVEGVELKAALARELGRHPVDRGDGLLPFLGADLALVGEISPADDVDDGLVQHAGRGVDEDEDAIATDLQTGQVLTIAVTDMCAYPVSRHLVARHSTGEPLGALLQ
jgi:hypothetical protein